MKFKLKQPHLHRVPISIEKGKVYITMSKGQWDGILSEAYLRGHTLLEVDKNENIVKAYQMQPAQ